MEQTIWCYGVVEPNGDVNAKQVRDDLAKFNRSIPVTLRINSPGGNVSEAIAIRRLLAEWPAGVVAQVDGLSASAASFLMTVAETTAIDEYGSVMIHDCWGATVGDAADHNSTAEVLDSISDTIATAYARKTKRTKAEVRRAMRAETWYTPTGACEFGLCDLIVRYGKAVALNGKAAARSVAELERELNAVKLQLGI